MDAQAPLPTLADFENFDLTQMTSEEQIQAEVFKKHPKLLALIPPEVSSRLDVWTLNYADQKKQIYCKQRSNKAWARTRMHQDAQRKLEQVAPVQPPEGSTTREWRSARILLLISLVLRAAWNIQQLQQQPEQQETTA